MRRECPSDLGDGALDQFGEFVWVTHMDHLSVSFYQACADGDRRTAANGDLPFGIGERVERFLLWLLDHDEIHGLPLPPRFNGMSIDP